jgi:hypothetical protein
VAAVIQHILVAIFVTVAVVVSAWKLMPAKRRLRALLLLDGWLAKRNRLSGWRERALGSRIRAAAGSGCAGCAANVGTRPHQPPR